MVWFGKDLKYHIDPPPAMGRDIFCLTQVAPSPKVQPALDTSRYPGSATASLGTLFQYFTSLKVNNFFLLQDTKYGVKPLKVN